ncbi:16S rRNA (cytosine(1402)-N(4))-methyltransferase RsmH [Candidatus Parcubacteria bacterium]|nr:MAG: 16S rRNA (cytosine(1402)-N(4))-methyltransferase RsmH [Candidatus Parcubacteria bacterium]
MPSLHQPVLLEEVIKFLNPGPGDVFIDCTFGGGGHTLALAKKVGESGKVIALDADERAIKAGEKIIAKKQIKNIILINGNFVDLQDVLVPVHPLIRAGIKGVLFDLGLSSDQLADKKRGFSFQADTPLVMAFGAATAGGANAAQLVNQLKLDELERILREYGEEKFFRRIAAAIVTARKKSKITTSGQLVEIIRQATPPQYRRSKPHFATRTFQALRIAVNKELDNLKAALPQAIRLLARKGRVAVISYHSLEDRIVKHFFRQESRDCLCDSRQLVCACHHQSSLKVITPKPVVPSIQEIKFNPRARSAKLRVAEKK